MKVPLSSPLDRGIGVAAARAASAGRSLSPATAAAADATPSIALQPRALTGELVVRMAAQGAPVDTDLVAAIRDSLARGDYPVDAQKIAAAMVALDLPQPMTGVGA